MSERQYVLHMIDNFAKPGAIFAMVADSYDVFKFCEMLGTDPEIKSKIEAHGATGGLVVIRPDSGDPETVCGKLVEILGRKFGYTVNSKGYKVLNNVRLIQGDGVNYRTINNILGHFKVYGWSADNIAFGMGAELLSKPQRDDQKFAMKCSAVRVNGIWRDVFKDPITDSSKTSKKGKVTLYKNSDGSFFTDLEGLDQESALITVYENGVLLKEVTFSEVRENAAK